MPMIQGGYGSSAGTPRALTQEELDARNAEGSARNAWNAQGAVVADDTRRANAGRSATAGAADRALKSFNSGGAANTAKYAPLNLQGYDSNQVASWQASAANLGSMASRASAAAGVGTSALRDYGSENLAGYDSSALKGFNANDVSNFDPSSFGKEFAGGAQSEFQTKLGLSLHDLENQGVGAGRLKTGFFTRDQGDVTTRLGSDFNAKIAQEAGVFSGQRLGALTSGAGMRLSRAQGIDANMLDRARGMDTNMLDRAKGMDANSIAAAEAADRFTLAGAGEDTARRGQDLTAASSRDTMGYNRANSLDEYGMRRANFLDTQGLQRETTGLDAALGREGRYMTDAQQTADRASDYTSATRDWASADRNSAGARANTASEDQQRVDARNSSAWERYFADQARIRATPGRGKSSWTLNDY